MRKASKTKLVHKAAVFTDTQLDPIDAIDCNEAIYHTLWSNYSSVEAFANNWVTAFDRAHQTYIIFDHYDKKSIKSHRRKNGSNVVFLDSTYSAIKQCFLPNMFS